MAAQAALQYGPYEGLFPNHRYVLVPLNGVPRGSNDDPGDAFRNWSQGGVNDRVCLETRPGLRPPPAPMPEEASGG